jgi:hypothetical protein
MLKITILGGILFVVAIGLSFYAILIRERSDG